MDIIRDGVEVKTGIQNIAKGKLVVASGWDTPPSNLANATDGNQSTVTGTGTKTLGADGTVGFILLDLGAVYTVLVGVRCGIWSTANQMILYLRVNNVNDFMTDLPVATAISYDTKTEENPRDSLSVVVICRYIRLWFYLSGAGTGYVKIYEINALKLT